MTEEKDYRSYNLLAYGIERTGLTPPVKPLADRNFTLIFEPFDTQRRFNEFDGVVLCRGIFESFKEERDWADNPYLIAHCNCDELDKRQKELELLLQKGGFVCFVLRGPFIDRAGSQSLEGTDLAKVNLNFASFYRENFGSRATNLHVKRDEFLRFLELYGAANAHFKNYNDQIDWRVIAEYRDLVVSMVLWDQRFFIPTLLPKNTPDRIEEFFRLLCDALTSARNKLLFSIPSWVSEFRFNSESSLLDKREQYLAEIKHIDNQLGQFDWFKRTLIADDDALVEAVAEVLKEGFRLQVDTYDEFREDLKILSEQGEPEVFVEVKGTNRGVKREHINQVDSHRERAGLPGEFPAMLVINTHIKNACTLDEKDQEVAKEQVKHAARTNVLVLRTYDLMWLLKRRLDGLTSREEVLKLFTKTAGWLKVGKGGIEVLTE